MRQVCGFFQVLRFPPLIKLNRRIPSNASPRDTLTTFIFTEEAAFITGNCRGHLEDITGHVTEKEN
jgi:hypothetical protein